MGVTLESLQRLQVIEQKRAVIRRAIEAKTRLIDIKRRNLQKTEERLKQNHLAARDLQLKLDALSLEVASRDESVSKHREALNKAKTNKEYAAILAALNTEKADNTLQEDDILKLMEAVRAAKLEGEGIESEQKRILEEIAVAQAKVDAEVKGSQAELNRLAAERETWAAKVLPGALAVFNRVAERHEGEALAPVAKLHPKREDYGCSGCNMKLTLDIVNSLRTRDEIQICVVCGRILYVDPATAPAK